MAGSNTPAILLRRIEFGDFDLIVTLFTLAQGKTSAIAKSAKKSVRRFPGVLEPFSQLEVVLTQGKRKGMPVLQEASLENPFFKIRENIIKTAYASYWSEIIYLWMAEGEPHENLYRLTHHVLTELNRGEIPVEVLSILFQMRFLTIAGFRPNFEHCHACKTRLDQIRHRSVISDPSKGGIACPSCAGIAGDQLRISKGTLKQLAWTDNGDLERAARVRFTPLAITEGLAFLEAFVPYHIGKTPKSLKVLRAVRNTIHARKKRSHA
ncbi:DNA repair protein RecO [Desulfosarcina ovata]|uniref:DNA repair protein RecO n=2 Tax=Desulfosarcina ovata TaxID=83564 RepID=A0A5K8AKX5_9BACT|nr:DNA repair protein RecO [Desulfosarcina ovata]BBO86398.1 DNA repair protein RecO [Desulfosarcina ovata subsp. sediminis]BBO93341.1 DNA repair protein RecO [Desulfosarcina ovata subsp. ovata]